MKKLFDLFKKKDVTHTVAKAKLLLDVMMDDGSNLREGEIVNIYISKLSGAYTLRKNGNVCAIEKGEFVFVE